MAATISVQLHGAAGTPTVLSGVDTIAIVHDLPYAGKAGGPRRTLDLYLPSRDAPTGRPVIVWVHGGGWAAGDKSDCPAKRFVAQGYAVASVNYRLSGDAIFPAQIEDCKAAIRWLRAHAADFNLDPARFGAWGNSAGGHLVALLGTTGGTKKFDVGDNLDQSSRVQAVSDFYGPTDLLQMDAQALPSSRIKHDTPNSPESRLVGGSLQKNRAAAKQTNPIDYVTADDPPFLIVYGDQDPMVPPRQNWLLFDALKNAGVTVHIHTVHGAGHGMGIGGPEVDKLVDDFFGRYLMDRARPDGRATKSEGESSIRHFGGDQRSGPPRPPVTWARAQRDDADKDGSVTRQEFRGPPLLFDILDSNHDGKLTQDDFGRTGDVK